MFAEIRPLAVQLRRIVHHGKEDPQNFATGNLLRIKRDFDRFRIWADERDDFMGLALG
jgi:hypothetical protein